MAELTDNLADLHARFVANRSEESRERCRAMDRNNVRKVDRMKKRGLVTVADLIQYLPGLPLGVQLFGIWLITVLKIRSATNVLLEMLPNRDVRIACASAIPWVASEAKIISVFIPIGQRELSANHPDPLWLSAVLDSIKFSSDANAAEILVSIFERQDLPGWLRGDAGDAIGCNSLVEDRRLKLHRRARDAAICGLNETNIAVKFWSMYVLASFANRCKVHDPSRDSLRAALPALRKIAKHDHRLAPGYWWPMSAEAEDAIHCIEHGHWKDPDAADRWLSNLEINQRGPRVLD